MFREVTIRILTSRPDGLPIDEGQEVIDRNFMEYGAGVEWNVTKKFLLSAGYLAAITGVNDYYQSDLNYSLSTTTFGFGGAIGIQ